MKVAKDEIIPSRASVPCGGWSWNDDGSTVPRTENYARKPRHSSYWTCELTPDNEHHQTSLFWRVMWGDVSRYVQSCPLCQLTKSDHRNKIGLLQPIPLPDHKWRQIITDLVTYLPESEGLTTIAVFVHFVPCTKETTAEKYALLFIDRFFELHGLPKIIISDCDLRFLGKFWDEPFDHLGTDLRFSAAFHPQTDGQTEVNNRVMEKF